MVNTTKNWIVTIGFKMLEDKELTVFQQHDILPLPTRIKCLLQIKTPSFYLSCAGMKGMVGKPCIVTGIIY